MSEDYISPGAKRRINGVWMPKDKHEALLARIEELEAENERLREGVSKTKKRIYTIVGLYAIPFEDNKWLRQHLDEVG